MRFFLELSYLGAPFHGWQSQPNAISVQQIIETALSTVLRHPTPIVGAGRTDTGVNARKMFAHFDIMDTDFSSGIATEPAKLTRFITALNRLCGSAITVHNIIPVVDDAHARFDALSRTYKYFVTFQKSSFLNLQSWNSGYCLDIDAMNECGRILLKTDDFTSFAKLHSDSKTNLCKVTEAYWEIWNNEFDTPGAVFTITADRFLRNMVRAVVGTMVDVGRGKNSPLDFQQIIDCKNRSAAGTSMPANALFLWSVTYPKNIFFNQALNT